MHDGIVLFTTPTITDSLGFPRDMWLGRSFIDFVHPKDRSTFASQITSGVVLPFSDGRNGISIKEARNSLYVLLRRYRGLQTQGFGVKGKSVSYEPFKLVLSFRDAPNDAVTAATIATSMLLVINATPVRSVYRGDFFIINLKLVLIYMLSNSHIKWPTRPCTNAARNLPHDTQPVECGRTLTVHRLAHSVICRKTLSANRWWISIIPTICLSSRRSTLRLCKKVRQRERCFAVNHTGFWSRTATTLLWRRSGQVSWIRGRVIWSSLSDTIA